MGVRKIILESAKAAWKVMEVSLNKLYGGKKNHSGICQSSMEGHGG
jgi:hypothetical protein